MSSYQSRPVSGIKALTLTVSTNFSMFLLYLNFMVIINNPFKQEGVKPLIHRSELRTYTKVVTFKEKSSFHFVVL